VVRTTGVQFLAGAGILSPYHHVQTASRVCPASYTMTTGGSFREGVKHEAYYSSPSSAKVKNVWSYTVTPPLCLHCM